MKRTACLIMMALLSACATAPAGMKHVESSDRIVYRIPSEEVDTAARFSGVEFQLRKYECVRAGFRYVRTARIVNKDPDHCEITIANVITPVSPKVKNQSLTLSKSYLFEVQRSTSSGITSIEFRPRYQAVQPTPSLNGEKLSPPDTLENAMELLATSGSLIFQFEVNSKDKASSVAAKFRKYCKEQSHLQHPVQILNHSFKSSYQLRSGDNPIATFYLSLFPEGKGTKALIIAKLQLAPNENYFVDAVEQSAGIKNVVLEIIKN